MKINDIYKLVTALLAKDDIETDDDYSERSTYLAAIFCCNMAALDRDIRESHRLPSQKAFNEVCLKLDDEFPLTSRFSPAASYYIASMLLADENEAEADKFFNLFANAVTDITGEIPSIKHKIINVYP